MKKIFMAMLLLATTACTEQRSGIELLDPADFTTTVNNSPVTLYTLKAGDITMQVTNYGGRVVSLWVPDRDGNFADIEIGYQNIGRYIDNKGERYLGAVVGPYANRIAGGRFTLDGKEYTLPQNDNGQTLHGGTLGLDRIVWNVDEVTGNSLLMSCTLPDGQDGFPGNRTVKMRYELTPENEFAVTYEGTTDAPTVMNISHHSFFNLKGEGNGTVLDNILTINASHTTPVDSHLIPTGEIADVEGTPFDFRTPTAIGSRIGEENEQLRNGKGYDHNWVIDREDDGTVIRVADLYEPQSGRGIEVWSDQIALQFYSGNFFDGSYDGKYGRPIGHREAVALETQRYPDSPNHADFPSCTLRPGEVYKHTCIYKFYTK
ncbi:MAG TPA: galactose mutarotase [Candidatus Alistipes excrementipullorum]|nr:galactose mutarotase [Candidatus Alistipes excrementipullorum]